MFKKILLTLSVLCVSSCLFFVGCGESNDLAIKLQPQSVIEYKFSQENLKRIKFERADKNESTDNSTSSSYEMVFEQKVIDVDKDSSVNADILIKSFKYTSTSTKGSSFTFDSSLESDKSKPMANLIGKSYKIKIAPNGIATLVDSKEVTQAVKGGMDARIAQKIFDKESVSKMHSIEPLAKMDSLKSVKPGTKWTIVEPSPKGMMQSKDYEKIYELKNLTKTDSGEKIANIEMTTIPADSIANPGMFAMFGEKIESDFNDKYTGKLVYNLDNGKIITYGEALETTWTVIDTSKASENKTPDTLKIIFNSNFSLEALN